MSESRYGIPAMRSSSPIVPVVSTRSYAGPYPAHEHPYAQVLLGLEGSLELELAGRAARVDATSALIIPPGTVHAFASERGARVRVVDAPPDGPFGRVRSVRLRESGSALRDALDCLALVDASPRALARRVVEPARLVSALDGRWHEPWPTARMAAVFSLSVPQFHERWLRLDGSAPQAWLRARRLDRAEALLLRGRSLEATALAVGYRSGSALGQALRRERGGSARSLRRRSRRG